VTFDPERLCSVKESELKESRRKYKRQEGRWQEKSGGGGRPRVMVCGGTSAAERICTHGLLETPVESDVSVSF
jgi:hypothetical protein